MLEIVRDSNENMWVCQKEKSHIAWVWELTSVYKTFVFKLKLKGQGRNGPRVHKVGHRWGKRSGNLFNPGESRFLSLPVVAEYL